MFIDYVKIYVKAGDGGNGCMSFAHFKEDEKGGPDGGTGGDGGDIIIEAKKNLLTLYDLRLRPYIKAKRGQHGKGKKKRGKRGENATIYVPLGTVVSDESGFICDLTKEKQGVIIAKGGRGGRGNSEFATPSNRTPRFSEEGMKGEEKNLILELKIIADVGIVGLPNAGKSTLLSALTSATPKIASYPFTTIHPNLGVLMSKDGTQVVIADIPGLIEGAYKGAGLGDRFLRHIERTKIIVHIIGLDDFKDVKDFFYAYNLVKDELRFYSDKMLEKPLIVVINKIDISKIRDNLDEIVQVFRENDIDCISISAQGKENLDVLIEKINEKLKLVK